MKEKLLQAIEEKTGLKMQRNHDFTYLSQLIFAECHEYLSPTTLKRMWGYIKDQNSNPSKSTLNLIACYLGYDSFTNFCNHVNGGRNFLKAQQMVAAQSKLFINDACLTNELSVGDSVIVRWMPDRCCTFKYMGNNMFEVTKSLNAQLSVGDTFCCELFVEGEMLKVYKLTHNGQSGMAYHAGKTGGIKFKVIHNKKKHE